MAVHDDNTRGRFDTATERAGRDPEPTEQYREALIDQELADVRQSLERIDGLSHDVRQRLRRIEQHRRGIDPHWTARH